MHLYITVSNFIQVICEEECLLPLDFKEAGERGGDFDLRKIFDDTLVSIRPIDAVTLVDNHDTQPGQALESWVNPQFKPLAYAFILLREQGYPCVFWGDIFGCQQDGDTPASPPMSSLDRFIKARSLFAFGPTRDYLGEWTVTVDRGIPAVD